MRLAGLRRPALDSLLGRSPRWHGKHERNAPRCAAGSRPYFAFILQEGQKDANVRANLGAIWEFAGKNILQTTLSIVGL